eukprot:CAMPEP_0170566812 /NCGR_PEP_ID=MMETSP0211-20121228/80078_1 /TAXON_ID=311385 /ORGANISM="Pseudokeronopsis sp., Strain OXSARD2" /LENGTH=70 /DNA_ID=CAMNT_0010888089 /DNA_START=733 /DNA_END=945 /DNA_ORIENTATION=+
MFKEFIESFEFAAIFYERKPCISNAYFMIQLEYFEFEELEDEDSHEEIVAQSLTQCNLEETAYREILTGK